MLLFGHRFIESEKIYHVLDIDSINNTPPSSIIYTEFCEDNLDIIKYAVKNSIKIALHVENITEVIYASSFDVSFIFTSKELAKTAQNIAENYLFDAKIIAQIDNEDEIEEIALLGIDGISLPSALIKINS